MTMASTAYEYALRLEAFGMAHEMEQIFIGSCILLGIFGIIFVLVRAWKIRGRRSTSMEHTAYALGDKRIYDIFVVFRTISFVTAASSVWLAMNELFPHVYTMADGSTVVFQTHFSVWISIPAVLFHIFLVGISIWDHMNGNPFIYDSKKDEALEPVVINNNITVPPNQTFYIPYPSTYSELEDKYR